MGAGNVLAVNGLFFSSDWAGPLPSLFLHWPKLTSVSWIPGSPLKFETFFYKAEEEESGYSNSKLVTDPRNSRGKKTLFNNSHICARYTVTEQKRSGEEGGFTAEIKQNKWILGRKCCEATCPTARMKTWVYFAQINLSSRWLNATVSHWGWEEGEFMPLARWS